MITVSNENLPTVALLCGDTPVKENRNTLQGEIFDGIELSVRLVMITVMVNVGNKVRTANISPVRCINVSFVYILCSYTSYKKLISPYVGGHQKEQPGFNCSNKYYVTE